MSHYDTLGVPRDADAETIKKAYKKKASQHHPDRHGGDDKKMSMVNSAYRVLGDPAKRAFYDQTGGEDTLDSGEVILQKSMFELLEAAMNTAFKHGAEITDSFDIISLLHQTIKQRQADANKTKSEVTKLQKDITRILKNIRKRKTDNDLIVAYYEMKRQQAVGIMVQIETALSTLAMCKKLVDDYEFVGKKEEKRTAFDEGISRDSFAYDLDSMLKAMRSKRF